jgi:hypothetical protein
MRSTFALGLAAVAGLATAQSTVQSNYPYQINPESVPDATRRTCRAHMFTHAFTNRVPEYWCDQNVAQCPLICLQQPGITSQTTEANDCDSVSSPSYYTYRTESGGAEDPWCSAQPDYHWLALSSAPQQSQRLRRHKANKLTG